MSSKANTYMTNPVEVEAYQWDGSPSQMYLVVGWILSKGGSAWVQPTAGTTDADVIRLELKSGQIAVMGKDAWAVCDSHGGFHLFKPDEFEAAYTLKE